VRRYLIALIAGGNAVKSCEIKLHFKGRCSVMIQRAGSEGERHVFLTLSNGADDNNAIQQIDFVLSERAASDLGNALISGSVGVMREFDL
jgi:hypothetical protein